MKKKIILPLSLSVAVLASCGLKSPQGEPGESKTENVQFVLASKLASGLHSAQTRLKEALSAIKKSAAKPSSTDPLAEVLPVLEQADFLVHNGKESVTFDKSVSEREGYEEKGTLSYLDLNGERKELVLFYNVSSEEESDVDEFESEDFFQGLLVDGETEFPFLAKTESELEGHETEESRELFLQTGPSSWVKSEVSFEEEAEDGLKTRKEKYSYEVIENSRTVQEYSYEIEAGDGSATEIELSYSGVEYELKPFEKNGVSYLKLTVEEGEQEQAYFYAKTQTPSGEVEYALIGEKI